MKTLINLILVFAALNHFNLINAQNLSGTYGGKISFMGTELNIQFHLRESNGGYTATMDSPDQNAFGLPVEKVLLDYPRLELHIPMAGIRYEGIFSDGNNIAGHLNQFDFKLELNLNKMPEGGIQQEIKVYNRPQEPKAPFPYKSIDVNFENSNDQIKLSGTITLPDGKGPFPGVVLVTGSGPQDRNSEILGHKPFWILSDYLSRRGIAVLRYDERGVGESSGNFEGATSIDFARDANAALQFLMKYPQVNPKLCGILGHSEGGIVAPLVATMNPEGAYVIILAGPGISGAELLPIQKKEIELRMGLDSNTVITASEYFASLYQKINEMSSAEEEVLQEMLVNELSTYYEGNIPEAQLEVIAKTLSNPWMRYFLKHDPSQVLKQIRIPVLAINGDLDLQVPASLNIQAIATALKSAGNHKVTTRIFPGLNHLFQRAETGLPEEYERIEETFNEEVMSYIAEWILALSVNKR